MFRKLLELFRCDQEPANSSVRRAVEPAPPARQFYTLDVRPRTHAQVVSELPRTIIIDFETSGLYADSGDRVIEIGAVAIEDDRIVDRFQSLVNPGFRIDPFIEGYTGITNSMLSRAPESGQVLPELISFMGSHPLVAHNANFDRKFLDRELDLLGCQREQEMICSMLISRRVYQDLRSHSLESLVENLRIQTTGNHHRALADAEMTAHLWLRMVRDLRSQYGLSEVSFDLMHTLSKTPKKQVAKIMSGQR